MLFIIDLLTFETVFTEENIKLAMEYLSTKKDSCGTDGVRLSDLEEYWKLN